MEPTVEEMPDPRRRNLLKTLAELPQLIADGWRADVVALRNWWRRRRNLTVDFVIMHIGGPLPERAGPPRNFVQRQLPLPPRPLSLQELNARLQRIADADNVRGAVFVLGDLSGANIARLQNLRRSLERLREAEKQVVVFTSRLDMTHYYVAVASDALYAPPGAQFDAVGLRSEAIFLRDALKRVGIEAEVLRVSPYKTAGNLFAEPEMTPEQKRQMTWLLDDTYDVMTADMAAARDLTQEHIQNLIDKAPFPASEALEERLLDGLAYEDELPGLLATGASDKSNGATAAPEDTENEADERPPSEAALLTWDRARPRLMEKVRRPSRQYIGVVSLDGIIVMGSSRQPPINLPVPLVGGAMAGEQTIVQLLRQAERDDNLAALILHVESGGGSAMASELIWRQIVKLGDKKPVLAYMGDVAASGGYFVSAGASHIMSQRSTLTGSIGVLMARMNPTELLDKLSVHRDSVTRGAHAGIYTEPRPLTAVERERLWNLLQDTYARFKKVVAQGRELATDDVEAIAGGRVWTGRQARTNGLVDEHGDFVDAVFRAAALCNLPYGEGQAVRTKNLHATNERYIPPQTGALVQELSDLLSAEQLRSMNGQPLLLMPVTLRQY